MKNCNFQILSVLLFQCFMDFFSIFLILILYLTGKDILFLVNVNFSIMFFLLLVHLLYVRKVNLVLVVILIISLIVSFLKSFFSPEQEVHGYGTYLNYFYGIVMPLLVINYTFTFKKKDYHAVSAYFERFSRHSLKISTVGILIYFSCYLLGYIQYFGLSVNLHYLYPFFLKSKLFLNSLFFMTLIVMTGKRAILANFFSEVLGHSLSAIRRNPLLMSIILLFFLFASVFLYQYTSLFDRYMIYFDLDFQNEYAMRIAFSGRFEEVVGVYNYFLEHPAEILFGAPPGATYAWDLIDHVEYKNYAHLTFVSYIFRYGLVFSLMLYASFIYILKKNWNAYNPFA